MSAKDSPDSRLPISMTAVNEEEQIVEQLRRENAHLCRALETRTQENALLNEVISTVGSTLRLDEVLHHLVDTVVRATSCHVAFIYLYDPDKERLILASTNQQYQRLVGKIEMALGEGIAGWVALHRKPVFLKDEAMQDPRFYYVPELEEEKFQSIMTVPIIAKDQHLIGVITLQAVAPHEFTREHRRFISNTAALVAGAIENAQLYENMQRKFRVLTSLSILSQTISSGLYLDEMLRSLATLTVQIMEVDLCVIMLMDQVRERETEPARQTQRLLVRATSPSLNDRASFHPIDVDSDILEQLRALNEASTGPRGINGQDGQHVSMSKHALEHLDPIRNESYATLISAPLIAGTEQLGLINCYTRKVRRYTAEDQTLITTIANQVAIAIKNSHLVNQLAQKNLVKGFFDDLLHGTAESEESLRQRANFLGCDLTRTHTVVVIEISYIDDRKSESMSLPPSAQKSEQALRSQEPVVLADDSGVSQTASLQATYRLIRGIFRRRIQDAYQGSLLYDHENLLTGIISQTKEVTGTQLKSWFQELTHQVYDEYDVHLSVGIGNACHAVADYRRGFAEAKEALQMGQNLHRNTATADELDAEPVVTHFNDLGVYRYLHKIAHMDDLRDVYQEQIARIARYDQRKNTELLYTLETYLEYAGNLTKTSEHLYVHRNTLIQRLDRLQSLCEVDLLDRSTWLTLQIAIKVYKLRAENG